MKIKNKKIILSLLLLSSALTFPVMANNDSLLEPQKIIEINNKPYSNSSYFNLANIVDNIITTAQETDNKSKNKDFIRKDFINATSKFNQGNTINAYDEYSALIDKIDNETSLLALTKVFYETGLFSLGDKAIEKITSSIRFEQIIADLKNSYKPKCELNKDDEIFYGKKYSDIYYNASAKEATLELVEIQKENAKNDYFNYTLSRGYMESKDYQKALSTINKAISVNPNNISYQIFKIDVLIKLEKYSDAENLIEKLQKNKNLIIFANDIELKKQNIKAHLAKKDSEKKYYITNKYYLSGNYEKTKKDCLNILNFDKNNDKILSLYAKAELATGAVERAGVYFSNSYKIEKNNIDTLIGLGDVRYIHGDYKNSIKAYKKAYKLDKNNYEVLIKLTTATKQYAFSPKELQKLENLVDKMPDSSYMDYYKSAISIAQKNSVLKEEFLKRSLEKNPMYEQAIGELIELHLKNKNYPQAQALIYNTSLTLEKNYYYYYLCGLYNQAKNNSTDAIQYYKTSLSLNPDFGIASVKLLDLIPDKSKEEI